MKKLLATFAFIIAFTLSVGAQSTNTPAVDPNKFYQPHYDYPANTLSNFWKNVSFDPKTNAGLFGYVSLLVSGGLLAYTRMASAASRKF